MQQAVTDAEFDTQEYMFIWNKQTNAQVEIFEKRMFGNVSFFFFVKIFLEHVGDNFRKTGIW
jgi:hypothetical protein